MMKISPIRFLLLLLLAVWAADGFGAIVIDSVVAAPSTCANNGSIKIYASGATSLLYAVVAGPDIRPAQSGNQFSAMEPGTYTLLITDFSNDSALVSAIVTGNYTFPDFYTSFQNPLCPNTATGIITGHILNTGKAPFTWVLTNTATNAVVTQASDTFYNLVAGPYSLRQYDSCQNFATHSVTLVNPTDSFYISTIYNYINSCDSMMITIGLYVENGVYAPPYTVQLQTHNGIYQHTAPGFAGQGEWPYFSESVPGISYGDSVNVIITDACGKTSFKKNVIPPFTFVASFMPVTDSCKVKYQGQFYINQSPDGVEIPNSSDLTDIPTPVTVIASNAITGAFIDSFVYTDPVYHYSRYGYSPVLSGGQAYKIQITDGCGNTYTSIYQWPVILAPYIQQNAGPPIVSTCFDSTTDYFITWGNSFLSQTVTFTLLSGPTSIGSSKPYFVYHDTLIYPQTYYLPINNGLGNGANSYSIVLADLGVGTYHYIIYDSCGNSITDSFTIYQQDVGSDSFRFSYTRGCPGENAVSIATNNSAVAFLSGHINQDTSVYVFNSIDTVTNVYSGPTVLTLYYNVLSNYGAIPVNGYNGCQVATDTIYIPPYQLPQIAYATQIKCNGTVNVGLLPDSSKGVPPYSYQIISGPQTYAPQVSNFFTFVQPGTYLARINDSCGFAQTFSFSVDTLLFQQVIKVGSSCSGNRVALTSQSSPYATYTWQRPDGTLFTGDSLVIDPVGNSDYGVYNITKYVNVNNCRDTVHFSYTLTSSSITNIAAAVCNGNGVLFAGHTCTTPGVYYDTIQTALCDSIVILNLSAGVPVYTSEIHTICAGQGFNFGGRILTTAGFYHDTLLTATGCDSIHALDLMVNDMPYDSAALTLCAGQSITVGTHTYNTTGIYYDTIITSGGCDSVYVLNLTVGSAKYGSVAQTICSGQSVTVGGHTYVSGGIYYDTLTTATGCDSIYVLNLIVSNAKYDSVSENICTGQSITVGSHNYNATGVYRDTFTTATGCDSIYILNLKIVSVLYDSTAQSICSGQSILVGMHSYSATGIYRDTLASTGGCDSVYILNLTVNTVKHDTIDIAFCTGDSAVINGLVYTTAGIYTDTFATTACDSLRTIKVTVNPRPVVQVGASKTTVAPGDTVMLNATDSNIYNYYWSSLAGLSNQYIPDPVLTPYQSVWVKVSAGNKNNCFATDSLYITVADCVGNVYAPNAFTPNGDGHNDEYRVYAKCASLQRLLIFNRWGEKVWETTDIEQGWNGYYKGVMQPDGVYVYFLTYTEANNGYKEVKELKGSITLIR